jgi:hypothetical protein
MSALANALESHEPGAPSVGTTLLALVLELNDATDSPDETVDRALRALDEGAVHLTGNFRNTPLVG